MSESKNVFIARMTKLKQQMYDRQFDYDNYVSRHKVFGMLNHLMYLERNEKLVKHANIT